jgi:hypothetical protein
VSHLLWHGTSMPWRSKHPLLTGHTRREPCFHVR